MQGLLRVLLAALIILHAHAFAAAGDGESGIVGAQQIEAMPFHELVRFRDRLNRMVFEVGHVVQRNDNKNIPLDKIRALGAVQTQETAVALLVAFHAEIMRFGEKVEPREEVFMAILDALESGGARYPHYQIEKLTQMREEFQQRFLKAPFGMNVINRIDAVYASLLERKETLISVEGLLVKRQEIENDPDTRLKRAEEILNAGIKGQPELVQAMLDMEWRSALYGKARELPDMIYLMGLPGTGKDTGAEVFADALNGYEGAWKEHLFRLPIMKEQSDLWKVNGSVTGYVGAENFPKFLEFLILHSDGKYILEKVVEDKKPSFRIVENPAYKGKTLPGYFAPNTGIVFANEFHNWGKAVKDEFLKQALERGIFTVNNQNGGLAEIHVPIRFVVASNEGISLIAAREASGERFGKPMSYEQLLKRWEGVHDNKAALRSAILATNSSPEAKSDSRSKPGVSEEFVNRINERFMILLRPLSPEHLREIAQGRMQRLSASLADSPLIGRTSLTWTNEITAFLQVYDYIAEENARPVNGRVESLIEGPIIDAVRAGLIDKYDDQVLNLDLKINEDGSHSLVIEIERDGTKRTIEQVMRLTLKDILPEPISDERIAELSLLDQQLMVNVFGIDPILQRLAQRALVIANETAAGTPRRVNVIVLNGPSSTGKTETAKQYNRFVNKTDSDLKTFDFSQIQTYRDFKEKILGFKDGDGNPVPSEFMKEYDRNNGVLTVAFDELANVRDIEVLKALYDFFREEVMTTFSDGKHRPMGGVTVVVTSNASQELYKNVPRDIPMEIQMMAWQMIYDRTSRDLELQRSIMERYFPEPLITRFGRNNIFFVPPHTYRSLRQLTQLKLGQALTRINDQKAKRGWNVVFPDAQAYSSFVTMIIDEGFSLRFQGESIAKFVQEDIEEPLKALLLSKLVPSGSNVVVKFRSMTANDVKDQDGEVIFDLYVDSRETPIEWRVRRPYVAKPLDNDRTRTVITSYHEAGHSLVRQALFRDAYYGVELSVIPGVDLFGDEWLYYLGVSVTEQSKEISTSRDWAVRQIAILLAGETAERMVTRGEVHSAGKSNDVARATKIAQDAILKFGLSEAWGVSAVPSGMELADYLATFSEKQKELLESEIQKLLQEGRTLAEQTILANYDSVFLPLGYKLLEMGKMKKDDLAEFYKDKKLNDPTQISGLARLLQRAKGTLRSWTNPEHAGPEVELKAGIPVPEVIADLKTIADKLKAEQFAGVPLPDVLPIGTNTAFELAALGTPMAADERPGTGVSVTTEATADCAARVASGR